MGSAWGALSIALSLAALSSVKLLLPENSFRVIEYARGVPKHRLKSGGGSSNLRGRDHP